MVETSNPAVELEEEVEASVDQSIPLVPKLAPIRLFPLNYNSSPGLR